MSDTTNIDTNRPKKRSKSSKSKSTKKKSTFNPFSLIFAEIKKPSNALSNDDEYTTTTSGINNSNALPPLPPNPSFFEVISRDDNAHTRWTLIVGSLAMVTIPIVTYFVMFFNVMPRLTNDFNSRVTWSAVAAVVAVQFVIAGFIAYAMWVDSKERRAQEEESRRQRAGNDAGELLLEEDQADKKTK